MTEDKTYSLEEFARAAGFSNRKLIDALRKGGLPMALNPAETKPQHLRWGGRVVAQWISGAYKGPLHPGESIAPAKGGTRAYVPRGPRKTTPKASAERTQPVRPEFAQVTQAVVDAPGQGTQEFVVKLHTNGTMTISAPGRLKS